MMMMPSESKLSYAHFLLTTYVCFQMCPKITALTEGPLALVTLVRLLTSVPSHVYFEGARSHELVATALAYVGPLP